MSPFRIVSEWARGESGKGVVYPSEADSESVRGKNGSYRMAYKIRTSVFYMVQGNKGLKRGIISDHVDVESVLG